MMWVPATVFQSLSWESLDFFLKDLIIFKDTLRFSKDFFQYLQRHSKVVKLSSPCSTFSWKIQGSKVTSCLSTFLLSCLIGSGLYFCVINERKLYHYNIAHFSALQCIIFQAVAVLLVMFNIFLCTICSSWTTQSFVWWPLLLKSTIKMLKLQFWLERDLPKT